MKTQRVHLERLIGKRVYDVAGKCAGRIEEIAAHTDSGECIIDEYHLGRGAWIERLSMTGLLASFLALLGGQRRHATHRVPWDQLDLKYPESPRLKCLAEQLEEIQPSSKRPTALQVRSS